MNIEKCEIFNNCLSNYCVSIMFWLTRWERIHLLYRDIYWGGLFPFTCTFCVICSELTQLGLKNCVKHHWMLLCFILFCPLQHTSIVYPPACWLSLLQLSNLISSPIGLEKWIKRLFIQHVCAFDWCSALFVLSQSCAHFVINWALFGRHFAFSNSL